MLYHFSEEGDIPLFIPRASEVYPHLPPLVWAIDSAHASHYCFPRDCPRVIYWRSDSASDSDLRTLFAGTDADKVIVVESGWLDRIRQAELYVYSFAPDPFERFAEAPTSGYYVSRETVAPLRVERVGDLLSRLLSEESGKLELRLTPDLHPIRDLVAASTLDFSIIRFRNAQGWAERDPG